MDQAMRNLTGVPGFDKILWFGFVYQSFVRMMGETQLGLNFIALSSCLTEVHSEAAAARILKELWEIDRFPETYEPSHTQFLALVKACSGVVVQSGFATEIDAMTGFGRWQHRNDVLHYSKLEASNPSDIAKVLNGLFDITRGKVEAVTLLGQNECAFIAALGHWLFDLATYVEDNAGCVLFQSWEELTREEAQVRVRYTQEDQPTALQQSTTYILTSGTNLIYKLNRFESRWTLKTPWDCCLVRTFGPTFRTLSGLAENLGSYLGGTARIYAALATGEPDVGDFSRHHFIGFTQLSYGRGFIQSVTSTFQELDGVASLYEAMESALDSSFDHASKKVEDAAESLRAMCRCDLCSTRSSLEVNSSPTRGAPRYDCLFALAMTIRSLVTALACTDRHGALSVAEYGLQLYYAESHAVYTTWNEQNEDKRTLVGIAVGLASVTDPNHTLVPKSETLLRYIRPLFDGSIPISDSADPGSIVATSSSGIYYFREYLRGISSKATAIRLIRIIPGHIERGSAQYDLVGDGNLDSRLPPLAEPVTITQADSSDSKQPIFHPERFFVKALATESSIYRQLLFVYEVLLPNGAATVIQPGLLSNRILERTGILTCYHSKTCKQQLAFLCSTVQKGWAVKESTQGLHYNGRIALCFWPYGDDLSRCIAFALQNETSLFPQNTFLRSDECPPCCSETILRESSAILAKEVPQQRKVAHVM